ncbi:cohesin domain-containing protein [Desulfobacterales bacterium HSG2]|nr:cohesin domain-containing protein [Desulfobacterales bacterium HSG2]
MKIKEMFVILFMAVLFCVSSSMAGTAKYSYFSKGNRLARVGTGTVNSSPTISDIQDQEASKNNPMITIPFTVSDAETSASALAVEGRSLNASFVPDENIVFGGSGSDRTVTITPADGKFGMSEIIVTVRDGDNDKASTSFAFTVREGDGPVLSLTPAIYDAPETGGSTSFTVKNTGSGTMNWVAEADVPWLTIESGKTGKNDGEIRIGYGSHSGDQRIGTIIVTSPDAKNSPQTVKVAQPRAPVLSIIHSVQKFESQTSFTTQVKVADAKNLGGFEIEIHFDPSVVCAQSVEQGDFLGSTGRAIFPVADSTDCGAGVIRYAVTTLGATQAGPDGSGILITINWLSLKSGSTSGIFIKEALLTTPSGNDILCVVPETDPCYQGGPFVKLVYDDQDVGVGQTFAMDITVCGVENLGSFEFELNFDPSVLEGQGKILLGDFLKSTGRNPFEVENTFDSEAGVAKYAVSTLGPTPPGPSGDGVLASITWLLKSEGEYAFELTEILLTDLDGDVIEVTVDGNTGELRNAIIILKMLVGSPAEMNSDRDVNGNGKVGLEDVIYILRDISG